MSPGANTISYRILLITLPIQGPIYTIYLASYPEFILCPWCGSWITTLPKKKPTKLTWRWVCILCLLFFPLAPLPLWIPCCVITYHYCPKCKSYLGNNFSKPLMVVPAIR